MNSTLMHNTFPMSYNLGNEFKFEPSDRHYSASTLTTGDFLERKTSLANGSLNQSLSAGALSNGLEYNATQMQHETPCHTAGSQLILTPPHSGDETSTSANIPSTYSFTYSTLPKVSAGNVSGADCYQSAARGVPHSSFNGTSMPQFDQHRPLQLQAPLSPPYQPYSQSFNTTFPPFNTLARTGVDFNSYSTQRNVSFDLMGRPRHVFASGSFPPSLRTFQHHSMANATPSRPEGPPFEDTQKIHSLVNSRGQSLTVDIIASIPKAFFRVDEKWTCYRRNYFSVSCAFTFKPMIPDGTVYLSRYSQLEPIHGYAVSIAAKTQAANSSESEARGLVQHTPKRDKATESIPDRHVVVPLPQTHTNGHNLPQVGLYSTNAQLASCLQAPIDAFGQSAAELPQASYTFERIQFQKATANNGKRRAQQQYFHVVVKVEVNVGRGGAEEWVVVASRQSSPIVVRGRSPGHYKDDRRHSQASMDPDPGSGPNDGNSTDFSMHHFGPSQEGGGIDGGPSHYCPSSHNCGDSFSHAPQSLHDSGSSPSSSGSSISLGSSPTTGQGRLLPYNLIPTRLSDDSLDRITLSPILSKSGSDVMERHHFKKRAFEHEATDCAGSFLCSALDNGYNNPHFDFSATTASQALCASS